LVGHGLDPREFPGGGAAAREHPDGLEAVFDRCRHELLGDRPAEEPADGLGDAIDADTGPA
jgi:hypothetical protein